MIIFFVYCSHFVIIILILRILPTELFPLRNFCIVELLKLNFNKMLEGVISSEQLVKLIYFQQL